MKTFSDHVALAKLGDNRFGSVCLCVCLSVLSCQSVCLFVSAFLAELYLLASEINMNYAWWYMYLLFTL